LFLHKAGIVLEIALFITITYTLQMRGFLGNLTNLKEVDFKEN